MKIAIDLPKDKNCMKCPCYIETRGQIGDQKMAFYVCRAFNRVLATHGISDICVDRCQECKDAEITKDTESAE